MKSFIYENGLIVISSFLAVPPDSRYILRRLDRFLAFPEESALMLRDFEANLLGSSGIADLLSGITHNLTKNNEETSRRNLQSFHKIICHFYLVSHFLKANHRASSVAICPIAPPKPRLLCTR